MPPTPRIGACGRPLGSCALTCIHLVSMGSTASHSVGRVGFAPQDRAGFAPQEGSFNPGVPRVKRPLLGCKPGASPALGCKPGSLGCKPGALGDRVCTPGNRVCTPGAPGLHPRGTGLTPQGRGKPMPQGEVREGASLSISITTWAISISMLTSPCRCRIEIDRNRIDRNRNRTSLTRRRVGGVISLSFSLTLYSSLSLSLLLSRFISLYPLFSLLLPSHSSFRAPFLPMSLALFLLGTIAWRRSPGLLNKACGRVLGFSFSALRVAGSRSLKKVSLKACGPSCAIPPKLFSYTRSHPNALGPSKACWCESRHACETRTQGAPSSAASSPVFQTTLSSARGAEHQLGGMERRASWQVRGSQVGWPSLPDVFTIIHFHSSVDICTSRPLGSSATCMRIHREGHTSLSLG